MAFFDWLRRLIEPKPRRESISQPITRRHRHVPIKPSVEPVQPSSTASTPPGLTAPTPTPQATQPAASTPTATLVVRLVDEANHPLQPALVITGALNATVKYRFPQIPGYALSRIHGFTQNFISEYGLTTVIYRRLLGKPIIGYLVDFDSGRLLALPQIHRGHLGVSFTLTPPTVDGYHIFQAQGPQRGIFSDHAQRVVYFYRRDSWEMVQRVHQYVFLQRDHDVYDEPNGSAYGYQFPADSLWRLFMIITLTNGDVWYNLGGNQWLRAADTLRRDHQLAHPAIAQKRLWQPEPFERLGTVDYVPGAAVTIYSEPYGEASGQLTHGEALDVRGRIIDDQHLTWYQIGPEAYINARYVRLVPINTI
ncbi:MucBP domain-containing protein [Levilactobacillus tujiorum]|uniref:MucBP domain-containing protein n=1 Tax=Levilactobacillus tujiorum TaxID=2912243 RepID=A0ABX1L8R7_9LACO|nr:MucBP domain-containing protein [Levilactobacillus tujiorum]MCH5465274.1 MucBP domain-containing protein [Levilactobacillus tujiorum]NLR12265.1 MucBP domain-containing protein [Lactobacillus sp. HBUAS51387]NLR30277.1 MucBP domain-containing protein [Levilactobacillus tujiorum]